MPGKLINLGSLCVDHVYSVPNIAGGGETVASTAHDLFPGGKGLNQSLAAAKAGAEVAHFGAVGEDGAFLLETLSAAGVATAGIKTLPGASGHAFIQVAPSGDNSIVISGGANRQLDAALVDTALAAAGPEDWLLLQNEIIDLEGILQAAHERQISVAFNAAPVDGREQHYPLQTLSLLIVNEIEAAALAGNADPASAFKILSARYPQTSLLLTLGVDGLLWYDTQTSGSLPAHAVEAVDETAAGDAFIGYTMAALLAGESLQQAARAGAAAGAIAVTRRGAASSVPSQSEVAALLG